MRETLDPSSATAAVLDCRTHLYPVTAGATSIRRNLDGVSVYDRQSKKALLGNNDLADLLELCTGDQTVQQIVQVIDGGRGEADEITHNVLSALQSLARDEVLQFQEQPRTVQIRVRRCAFDFPLNTVYLEPTRRCNLRCSHCYASSPSLTQSRARVRELSNGEYFSLIDALDQLGVMNICLTGGEPFYRKDCADILSYAVAKNIEIGLFTNGVLLNEDIVRLLRLLNPRFIAIGLDSHDSSVYRRIRGADAHAIVVRNIRLLVQAGVNPRINCVLFRGLNDSLRSIERFLHFSEDLGIKPGNIGFDQFCPEGEGTKLPQYTIDEKVAAANVKRAFASVFGIDYYPITEHDACATPAESFCGLGTEMCYITSTGDIALCPALTSKTHVAGSICSDNIADVWRTAPLFSYFRKREFLQDSECETCAYLGTCLGGCKAKALTFHGRLSAVDPWMCAYHERTPSFGPSGSAG